MARAKTVAVVTAVAIMCDQIKRGQVESQSCDGNEKVTCICCVWQSAVW